MVSPPSNADKHNHVATTSATTTTITNSSTSLSPSVGLNLNNPSATFDVAPSPTLITIPVETSTDSTMDSPISAADSTSRKKGRGKVELKKMEKESNLLVTFSKRRSGLFKKANELCVLCGVECAVVVFSPAGKVFSFGHPSVDTVVNRFLTGNQMPQNQVEGELPQDQGADIEYITAELTDLMDAFEFAKKNSQSLDQRRAERQATNWFERPLQQMNLVQLDTLRQAMTNLKSKVYEQVGMRMETSTSSSTSPNPLQWLHQNYPSIHEAAGSSSNNNNVPSFAGYPSWSNKDDTNEASPSGVK